MKIDSYRKLRQFLSDEREQKPKLLLHSCCAPCSSYVLEYLQKAFAITILFHNPNIYPQTEYEKRLNEFTKLNFPLIKEKYQPEEFAKAIKGLENIPEGGERCFACYALRLERTAQRAQEKGFDYFSTTLSISPYKNSDKINEIGFSYQNEYQVNFLFSNFKKNDGYKKSITLSKKLDLYRQNYCGCYYSLQERKQRSKIPNWF